MSLVDIYDGLNMNKKIFGIFLCVGVIGVILLGTAAALRAYNVPPDPYALIGCTQEEIRVGLCTYAYQYSKFLQEQANYTAEMWFGGVMLVIALIGCFAVIRPAPVSLAAAPVMAPPVPAAAPSPPAPDTLFCTYCGAALPPDAAFCLKCGSSEAK